MTLKRSTHYLPLVGGIRQPAAESHYEGLVMRSFGVFVVSVKPLITCIY